MGPLSIEQVLAEEERALGGRRLEAFADDSRQTAARERTEKDADARDGKDESRDEVERRKAFYRSLNKFNRSALCLSGGGIRSATLCLGVIQALATFDVTSGMFRADEKHPAKPENSLLGRFHYLRATPTDVVARNLRKKSARQRTGTITSQFKRRLGRRSRPRSRSPPTRRPRAG